MERKKREGRTISEVDEIKDEDLVLLLQLIKKNGNTESLHRKGYQYSQIAKIITMVLHRELAYYTETGLSLSPKGEKELLNLNRNLERKNSEAMISPQAEYVINKRSKFDLYLPENTKKLR